MLGGEEVQADRSTSMQTNRICLSMFLYLAWSVSECGSVVGGGGGGGNGGGGGGEGA